LQKKFCDVPLIDVALPSIYETMLSGSSNVGITGTLMTINTHLHKTMLMKNNKNLNVIEQACPLLAESIENCDNKKIDRLLQRYLKPFLKNNVDTILLGCTHYIFAAKNFKKAFPYPIKLIDGRTFIHDKIKNFTQESSNNSIKNRLTVTVTGNQKSFEQSFKKYKVLSD
ncbi:hypothetical protein HN446_03350, partial [bacterium]|nr:hypothetical protein [bacterium]